MSRYMQELNVNRDLRSFGITFTVGRRELAVADIRPKSTSIEGLRQKPMVLTL